MIRLYTPLPPSRTGTAFYAALLLRDLRRAGFPAAALRVVVEDGVPGEGTRTAEGHAVVGHRSVPNVVGPGETAVFVIANNDFHAYVHACLRDVRKVGNGRVIVLLHEPACWMLLNKISHEKLQGFSDETLVANLSLQYGDRARTFIEQFRRGDLPPLFEHVTHALAHVLAKADEIWTHSAFAGLKLILESDVPLPARIRFRLVDFPFFGQEAPADGDAAPAPARAAATARFTVGAFGWVAEPKRILQAIEGYYRFLCRLEPDDLARVDMIVAGEMPDRRHYDPVDRARRLGIADRVAFHGFVEGPRFAALQEGCAVTLNLRFPSSGETSGTLTLASGRGAAAVVTRYQAFREAEATASIDFLPGREIDQIADRLHEAFLAWRDGMAPPRRHRPVRIPASPIAVLLGTMLLPASGPTQTGMASHP